MEKHITLPREGAIDRTVLMEGKDNAGHSVAVNRSYFLKDGKPWLPVMGEIHYGRLEEKDWKRALAKMKAGGIDIVATYVFWIYHEEVEGRFDWTGRRNLRHFIELCEEAGLAVLLRIGPWDHGEVRNGGYPDWLLQKDCNPSYNNEEYFGYAKKLYDEIFAQVEGFLYKDGRHIHDVVLGRFCTCDDDSGERCELQRCNQCGSVSSSGRRFGRCWRRFEFHRFVGSNGKRSGGCHARRKDGGDAESMSRMNTPMVSTRASSMERNS